MKTYTDFKNDVKSISCTIAEVRNKMFNTFIELLEKNDKAIRFYDDGEHDYIETWGGNPVLIEGDEDFNTLTLEAIDLMPNGEIIFSSELNDTLSFSEVPTDILAGILECLARHIREMVKVRFFDIEYDTDGEEVELPQEIVREVEKDVIEGLGDDFGQVAPDLISDETGWCVINCDWEILGEM